jgi:anion-transporting  ArsA/GET3 family ATPase
MTDAPSLAPLLEKRRVVLSVGCGGVGKTTTSAALAVAAARRGKRVLCLTIDPARRLAQSLGLSWATTEAQDVDASLLARIGVPASGRLTIMRVDTKATFDGLVAQLAPSAERRDRILSNVLYRYISTSLAGTQEYMAMEKVYALRDDPRWDLLIVDTPPTTNALDFLDAPERLVGAIDSPAVRWFVQAMEGSTRFRFDLVAQGAASLLRGVSKLTGSGFLEQVAAFVTEINAIFGGWKKRADAVSSALRGPDVAYVLVTTPDPLAIREVEFFAERLRQEAMHTDAVVVNRVHPAFPEVAEHVPQALEELELVGGKVLADKCVRAMRDASRQSRLDRLHLVRLEGVVGDSEATVIEVPAYASDVYDLDALAELGTALAPV